MFISINFKSLLTILTSGNYSMIKVFMVRFWQKKALKFKLSLGKDCDRNPTFSVFSQNHNYSLTITKNFRRLHLIV